MTVVRACMLAALIVEKKLLKMGNNNKSYKNKASKDPQNSKEELEGENDDQANSQEAT